MSDTPGHAASPRPRHAADALRARLALPRPGRHVPRRQAARASTASAASSSSGRTARASCNVLDGYCRHMGGDLTQGAVKGDEIACPFHDWRWGGDGKCKAIPYARRVPLRARTQRYDTAIRNDQLLVWHDPEGSAARPRTSCRRSCRASATRRVHRLGLGDRADRGLPLPRAHRQRRRHGALLLRALRRSRRASATSSRATEATQFMESKGRPDMSGGYGDAELFLKSEATYYGPAYMINWLDVDYKGFETEVILINCHIPTGPDSFTLQYGITVKKPEGLDDKTADYIAKKYAEMFGERLPPGRAHLEEQGAGPEPAAVRGGRAGLPAASLVRAVLRRRGRHRARDGRPVRVRGRHHQGQRVLAGGGRREPRPKAEEDAAASRRRRPRLRRSDGLLRPDQRRHARGPAALHAAPGWPRSPASTAWPRSG